MKKRSLVIILAVLTLSALAASSVLAGDYGDPDTAPEPPQQQSSVARLSVVRGQVSTAHGDNGEYGQAAMNTPVLAGDRVATGDGSRAEVQLDPANVMRLEERTEAKVADLEPNKILIQLASGVLDFSVLNGTQADVEIDTPNMGVHPLSPGLYRVQVLSDTETQVIVRYGETEVLTNQGSTKAEAGQMIQVRGADNPEYRVDQATGEDDFDRWSMDRDRQIADAQSWQHSDRQITGTNDLDTYGQWNEVPDYGWCWTPQVDAGWVPYSAGNWGYEPYWGWTWISAEPWGWAPYHYGRWFSYGGAWRWSPGIGFGLRPMWAPAYVSFFGFGGGFGVGLGFGSIGWLALGPRDIFHPWFGAGHSFAALRFNDFHGAGFVRAGGPAFGSNLDRMMTDARIRSAVMNVSAHDFASGRVMGRAMPASEGMLRGASVMRGSLPVSHASFAASRSAGFSGNRGGFGGGEHFFSSRGMATGGHTYGGTQSFGARSNSGGFQGRGAPAGNSNWQRYASPNRGGYSGARNFSGNSYYGGSRQSLNLNRPIMNQRAPSSYYGGGSRGYSGSGSYGGNRGYSGGYGGNRSYSAPRSSSAPSGGRSYSAPRSSEGGHSYGGGGGGHSSGGHGGGGRR